MTKLKYRFILWLATLLGCRYLIDFDEYDNVVPRKIKAHHEAKNKPDGLLSFYDPLKEHLGYSEWYANNRGAFLQKLRDIELGRTDKPFTHYEAPKKDDTTTN